MWNDKPSLEGISKYFACDQITAKRLFDLWYDGFEQGIVGEYSDADYASDPEWMESTGQEISRLEQTLQDDIGEVFELYCGGHSAGYLEYEGEAYRDESYGPDTARAS